MITVYGFGNKFGTLDASPFVLKVLTYLKMAKINFIINTDDQNLKMAPKGKLPFIDDDGTVVADSQMIIDYLVNKYGDQLDSHLSQEDSAMAYLLSKSLDEHLYFCLVYSRWISEHTWPTVKNAFFAQLPPVVRDVVPYLIRKSMKKGLYGQGINRHSHQEIEQMTDRSIRSLSQVLADKPFMFGDQPCSFDATCYGFLAQFIEVNIDNPFIQQAKKYSNVVNYCASIKKQYF